MLSPFQMIEEVREATIDAPGDGQEIVQALMHAALSIVASNGDCPVCALREAADMIEEYEERQVH